MDLVSVQKNARKLRKMLNKLSRPLGPAAVHKLRVRISRFESAVAVLQNTLAAKPAKKLKPLRKLRKKAGKVRDLDVFASSLASLRLKNEEDCFVELLLHIAEKRTKQSQRLADFAEDNAPAMQEKIEAAIRKLNHTGRKTTKPDEETMEQVRRAYETAFLEAARVPRVVRANLHEYRKTLKALRDVVVIAAGKRHQKLADALDQAKDAIGEWHDWEELSKIGDKMLKHGQACGLQKKLHECRETKFREALRAANKVRAEHLKPRQLLESATSV